MVLVALIKDTTKQIMNIAQIITVKNLKYITYLDVNNLHGHAMSQYLPYASVKWVNNIN